MTLFALIIKTSIFSDCFWQRFFLRRYNVYNIYIYSSKFDFDNYFTQQSVTTHNKKNKWNYTKLVTSQIKVHSFFFVFREESVQNVQSVQERSNQFDLFSPPFKTFKAFKSFKPFKSKFEAHVLTRFALWTLWTVWTFWTPYFERFERFEPSWVLAFRE